MWPSVIEKENGREKIYDIPSRLLLDRIILLTEPIDSAVAASTIGQLLYLESQNPEEPITMYINSPGGSITDGLAIYDIMNKINCPVNTVCTGMAASMAAFLLCAGTGTRYAMPNSTIMIHQPLGGVQGQATDIAIVANRILNLKTKLYKIFAQKSGSSYETISAACERDNYLSPSEAQSLGLIDKIVNKEKEQ